jgi:hypothetical protein
VLLSEASIACHNSSASSVEQPWLMRRPHAYMTARHVRLDWITKIAEQMPDLILG